MPSEVYYIDTKDNESNASLSRKLDLLIRASGVLAVINPDDFTAVKIHFGEQGNTVHIEPSLAATVIKNVAGITKNAFLTDSNVLYKGTPRNNAIGHIELAREHGFSFEKSGVPVIIADGLLGNDYVEVPINKKFFKKVKVASAIANSDSMVVLTHITGHILTGFAGTMKNIGMGCAARIGKYEQHAGVVPTITTSLCIGCGSCVPCCPAKAIKLEAGKARISSKDCIGCGECVVACRTMAIDTAWDESLENLQQKMVEYAYGALQAIKRKACYLNFLIKVTDKCDCMAKDDPRVIEDAGIVASLDPVSVDKASADILRESIDKDIFKKMYPDIDWMAQLRYAAELGLGSLEYKLIKVKV